MWLDDQHSQHLILTQQDVQVMEGVDAALNKVPDFTEALSSEKTVAGKINFFNSGTEHEVCCALLLFVDLSVSQLTI